MIAVHAGTAYLQQAYEDDVVDFAEVTGEALAGSTPAGGGRLLVPRLRGREHPHRRPDGTPLAPWAMRLSRLLAAVRREHGDADLSVRWSDDGERCVAGDVGRLAEPLLRNSYWVEATPQQRALAAALAGGGAARDGQVDLRALTDAARRLGWATHVVTQVYGGGEVIAMRARPMRSLRHAGELWAARAALRDLLRQARLPL